MKRFNDGRDWFFESRFGLFVHWGLYAIQGWHEQDQWRRRIPKSDYVELAEQFNPTEFDPDAWMEMMQQAGMEYICVTAKHHDGFCLWDSEQTDYCIRNTPYGKDIIRQLADACARHNIKLCLYYSCPDWHHPNAINQGGDHQLARQSPGDQPDNAKYLEYVRNQITELCTHYGKIHGLFWDIPPQNQDASMNALVRGLQPGIMINDRGWDGGDYNTPERHVPEGLRFERPTEANQSVGQQSWGYRIDEDYHAHKYLMQSVGKIMAMGGNYLLNVGPKADGTIPAPATDAIARVGNWYRQVKDALVATPCSEAFDSTTFMATRHQNTLYIHFYEDPASSGLVLRPLSTMPRSAIVLNSGEALRAAVETVPALWRTRPFLHIQDIPVNTLLDEPIILKLEFESLDNAFESATGEENGKWEI